MSIRQSILTKLRSLSQVAGTAGGRAFWMRPTKQDDLPCVAFYINGGQPGEIDSCGPTDSTSVSVTVYAMARKADDAIAIAEEFQASSPTGLHGASWEDEFVKVQLCAVTEFIPDEYAELPFVGFIAGCVMEIQYAPIS